MDREYYKPAVVVWNYDEHDTYTSQIRTLGVPLHSFPLQFSALAKMRALRRLIEELQPEVAHSYSFYTNFAVYWATRNTQTVPVGSVRNGFVAAKRATGWWLGRLSARWPREQIWNSFAAFAEVRQGREMFTPKRLFVIRNGLDFERFHHTPLSPDDRVCIIGVGSLVSRKRWDRLLRAALALKQQGANFLVRIVGDGPLRVVLRQQTQTLGITDCVEFLGNRDDVPSLLAEATFLVHTSDDEGCPNVVMEAMACGRAVVGTDVADIPLLIEDGKTGFVVPRNDEMLLVTRIATMMSDRELCLRMGNAARVKAEQEFSLDRLISETLEAYQAAGWKGYVGPSH
jgi:glycosyltransferase involved in cell wall biosynthesis